MRWRVGRYVIRVSAAGHPAGGDVRLWWRPTRSIGAGGHHE